MWPPIPLFGADPPIISCLTLTFLIHSHLHFALLLKPSWLTVLPLQRICRTTSCIRLDRSTLGYLQRNGRELLHVRYVTFILSSTNPYSLSIPFLLLQLSSTPHFLIYRHVSRPKLLILASSNLIATLIWSISSSAQQASNIGQIPTTGIKVTSPGWRMAFPQFAWAPMR